MQKPGFPHLRVPLHSFAKKILLKNGFAGPTILCAFTTTNFFSKPWIKNTSILYSFHYGTLYNQTRKNSLERRKKTSGKNRHRTKSGRKRKSRNSWQKIKRYSVWFDLFFSIKKGIYNRKSHKRRKKHKNNNRRASYITVLWRTRRKSFQRMSEKRKPFQHIFHFTRKLHSSKKRRKPSAYNRTHKKFSWN